MKLTKKTLIIAAGLVILYLLGYFGTEAGVITRLQQVNLMIAGINIIMAVSLNLIVGFTGQLNLGHAGFMAVGAYVAAICTAKLDQPFIVALIAGAVAAGIVGLIIGIPTLRLRGDYLAIATLGMGEIIRGALQNIEYVGAAAGMRDIPHLTNWSWMFWAVVISCLVVINFINSDHGRACMAVRDNELAAEAVGVNTTYYKVLAFTIGAMLAGLAGGLYAHYFYVIQPGIFSFMRSFDALVMVVFGGLGSTSGAVVAALGVTGLNMALQNLAEMRMVIYAALLVIIMVFRPQGLMGTKEFTFDQMLGRPRWHQKGESR
ncbi:MAG: branched-chain amino acid ABC transporter permease [Clostridia bacterium]|nr:branched-chain amino acid ABC transporter permease [Clostridia bacterium]